MMHDRKRSILWLAILSLCALGYGLISVLSDRAVSAGASEVATVWLASGFGLGYLPLLPGTAGALGGLALSLLTGGMSSWRQAVLGAALLALAIPLCDAGSRHFEGPDDARIVADEMLAFPVATLGLPIRKHHGLLLGVFVTSRLFDHLKPPPANAAEGLPGGIGIVLDDVAANVWTLAVGWLGWCWLRRRANPDRP